MPACLRATQGDGAARRSRPRLWWALLSTVMLGGCALGYMDTMQQVNNDLAAQQPEAALKALNRLSGGKDEVLYLLNKAMVLRMTGDYAASAQNFEQAKPLMDYLEATSVSESAAAYTFTENLRAYQPPLYERLLAHVYQGLNYLQLGEPDQARVEALQIDDLLKRLYPATAAAPNGGDAFPRYFSGLVFEDMGEYSDAMIAYRQAYKAYKAQGATDASIPDDLKVSLCRFADYLGLADELKDYKSRFGLTQWPAVSTQEGKGQIVFLFSEGLGPVKVAQSSILPDPFNGHYYSVSLPELRRRTLRAPGGQISAGGETAETQRVASIDDDAAEQLKADRPRLLVAEFSRNVAREAAANQADKKTEGLGSLLSLVASAVDQADTRIWESLPDNIQLARLRLDPGTYDLTVRIGGAPPRVLKNVVVRAGQMSFTSLQWTSLN